MGGKGSQVAEEKEILIFSVLGHIHIYLYLVKHGMGFVIVVAFRIGFSMVVTQEKEMEKQERVKINICNVQYFLFSYEFACVNGLSSID